MRYVRIFLLHFQEAFDNRGVSFVWFLIPLINVLLLLLFWVGAYNEKGNFIRNWSVSSISSYYFFLLIASSFLEVHIEEDVARKDIQQGELSKYLTKPHSYFWLKFFEEFSWRIIQGFFSVFLLILFFIFFGSFIKLNYSIENLILSLVILVLAFLISFIFKMVIGLSAFWIIDYSGLQQLVAIVILIFAGFVIPLDFFPSWLKSVAYILPFSYMIYFPIVAFSGKLIIAELFRVIIIQFLWILILTFIYKTMWKNGVKKFTAFGQ